MILSCILILDLSKSFLALFVLPVYSMAAEGLWASHSSACARCRRQITPIEELVVQFYPGLFNPTPPSQSVMDQDTSAGNFVYSASAEIPTSGDRLRDPADGVNGSKHIHGNENAKNTTRLHKSRSAWESTKEPKAINDFGSIHKAPPSCCETVLEYMTPPNVTVKGKVYRVVHLRNAFQFIPVAKCKPGTSCWYGDCVERFRVHWVLVYNTTQPHTGPPVNFTPLEVPSHCECLNVGKP